MANVGPYSIVLLFENQANSLQVVQSLREKGLDVHTVNNAGELIQIIATRKFDLVCLSVNHPSASSLVQVLKIKTHVAVLMFGEDASTQTAKAVLKTAADYQVTGAISSYNIWLKIGHLVKEKQRHNETASRMLSGKPRVDDDEPVIIKSAPKHDNDTDDIGKVSLVKSKIKEKRPGISVVTGGEQEKAFKVKGAANEKNGSVNVVGDVEEEPSSKVTAPKKDKKMLMGAKKKAPKIALPESSTVEVVEPPPEDIGDVDLKAEQAIEDTAEVTVKEKPVSKGKLMKKGAAKELKAPGRVLRPTAKTSKKESAVKLTEEELIDREIDQMQSLFFEGDGKGPLGDVATQKESQEDVGAVMVFGDEVREPTQVIEKENVIAFKKRKLEEPSLAPEASSQVEALDESSYETEADKIVSIEAARAQRKKLRERKKAVDKVEVLPDLPKVDRLKFKKLFRDAVAKAGQRGFQKSENTNSIGVVSRISLIPVDNSSERGFIIIANSQNNFSTIDEVSGFKDTLVAEMRVLDDVKFALGDTYNIETSEVDVAAWAERSSQFFYTFEDPTTGKQMLICFLKKDQLFPNARKMSDHKMHRIDIHELPPKMAVSFDAYLFLARNDKMLPYLRRGGSLTSKQIQRLYQRGFKFLYVKDENVRDYYEFYLSLHLNQDFRAERKLA